MARKSQIVTQIQKTAKVWDNRLAAREVLIRLLYLIIISRQALETKVPIQVVCLVLVQVVNKGAWQRYKVVRQPGAWQAVCKVQWDITN